MDRDNGFGVEGCHRHADAIAIAPYFGHRWGNPKSAERTAALSVNALIAALREDVEQSSKHVAAYTALAKKHGAKLFAYEGGQHLVGYGGAENEERLTKLFHAANRHAGMKELYLQDLRNWQAGGGELFCVFASMGRYSKWGSWGVLEHTGQDEKTAPKYAAIREYLTETGRRK